ncbi:hypothetical Protein YC6258_04187 [Gynuella sunshinyii YC6258]|uniref:Uncharacterized protein n=1 Tax=Gynuella sunshinyii YC6258 TaxID=1445510 RepID=A0A0C5VPR9_9GAMM|nr:hypothetical Protein YC6258_04187 [Gynuella sunshinyii YC6258]
MTVDSKNVSNDYVFCNTLMFNTVRFFCVNWILKNSVFYAIVSEAKHKLAGLRELLTGQTCKAY